MADTEVTTTKKPEPAAAKGEDSLAPVKRDRRLHIPLRHIRAIVFVSLSLIILSGPLVYNCRKFDDPHLHQLIGNTYDPERRSIRQNLGKGKEVFTLLAESVIAMPDDFYSFDRVITRIATDTHRLQRDLRGLIYLAGQPDHTHAVIKVAAKIEAIGSSLESRTLLLNDLVRLRTLLNQTEGEDTGQKCNDVPHGEPDEQESINLTREFLRTMRTPPKGAPATEFSTGKVIDVSSPTEHASENTVAQIYRHLTWRRMELLDLIDKTLWPQQESAPSTAERACDAAPRVKLRMAHALALQRIGNGLSKASYWVSLALACLVALFWYRMWVGRQYALGRGRWRAQLVFYVFIVLQIYNVILVGAYQPNAGRIEEDAISTKTASLRDAYKTATQEIYHRLEQEQHFYILKFTMIGSLLAVFFRFLLSSSDEKENPSPKGDKSVARTRPSSKLRNPRDAIDRLRESKIAAFFFWAAVIINCILDTRLRYNAIICNALGRWIRTLESSVEEYGVTGWETFFEQQAPISSSPLMQVAPTLLTTIVFVLTVVLFVAKEQSTVSLRGNNRDNLHPVNLVFGGIAFTTMGFSDLGQPGMPWEWAGPVLVWIMAGMVVLYLGPKVIHGRVFRRDEITDSLIGYAFPFHYFDFHNTPWWPEWSKGIGEGSKWEKIVAGVAGLGRYIWAYARYMVFWSLMRVGSYVPFPPLRRRLVKCVNRSLELKFIHLEVNQDPLLIDALVGTSDGNQNGMESMIWSLLYLQAGSHGLKRLKRGLRRLNVANNSSRLAASWLKEYAKDFVACHKAEKGDELWTLQFLNQLILDIDSKKPIPSKKVHYCRVHDYYDEHNPWVVFMWEIGQDNKDSDVVILSVKDVFSHQNGILRKGQAGGKSFHVDCVSAAQTLTAPA